MEKTNVMRLLEQKKIPFEAREYSSEITDGVLVAKTLGENEEQVFKTLVTIAASKKNYVFVIPVAKTLDLKAAARAAGEKSISMLKQKELLPLTGYIHGGCSPIGMKKKFATFFDSSALSFDRIFVSAGKVGYQICISPNALSSFVDGVFCELSI